MFLTRCTQSQLFICLGKLLDKGNDSASANKLLEESAKNYEIFGTAEVRRRLIGLGQLSERANEKLETTEAPAAQDIERLKRHYSMRFAEVASKIYEIRNKWYTHAGILSDENIKELFSPANREKIERLLRGMFELVSQVRWMVNNGGRPDEADCGGFELFVSGCRDEFSAHIGG